MNATTSKYGRLDSRLVELESRAASRTDCSYGAATLLWNALLKSARQFNASGDTESSTSDSGFMLAAKALARGDERECMQILTSARNRNKEDAS